MISGLLLGLFLSVFTFDSSICLPNLRDLYSLSLVHDHVSLCRVYAFLNMILSLFVLVIILKLLLCCQVCVLLIAFMPLNNIYKVLLFIFCVPYSAILINFAIYVAAICKKVVKRNKPTKCTINS
jgi:hypothetical protein